MKHALTALLVIFAAQGVTARAEASKKLRERAVEICENSSAFLDQRSPCLKAVAITNQIDESAIESCAEQPFSSGRLECLKDILGKTYSYEDKKACFEYFAPSRKAECFRRRGTL